MAVVRPLSPFGRDSGFAHASVVPRRACKRLERARQAMPLVDVEGLIGPIVSLAAVLPSLVPCKPGPDAPTGQVIGSALGACACGIVLALSAHYFARFQQDKLWLRCAVVGGLVLALADTAATCSWAYRWGLRMFGQTVLLIERPWQLPVAIYLCVFSLHLSLLSECLSLTCTLSPPSVQRLVHDPLLPAFFPLPPLCRQRPLLVDRRTHQRVLPRGRGRRVLHGVVRRGEADDGGAAGDRVRGTGVLYCG